VPNVIHLILKIGAAPKIYNLRRFYHGGIVYAEDTTGLPTNPTYVYCRGGRWIMKLDGLSERETVKRQNPSTLAGDGLEEWTTSNRAEPEKYWFAIPRGVDYTPLIDNPSAAPRPGDGATSVFPVRVEGRTDTPELSVPKEVQISRADGPPMTFELVQAFFDGIVYQGTGGPAARQKFLRGGSGRWTYVERPSEETAPFVKQDRPLVLTGGGLSVWKTQGGTITTSFEVVVPPVVERAMLTRRAASAATLPYQPRRLASRAGADWHPSVEADLQHVMASLEEIKRALNDAQLLKEALTA
jgi:hypothetical protein